MGTGVSNTENLGPRVDHSVMQQLQPHLLQLMNEDETEDFRR